MLPLNTTFEYNGEELTYQSEYFTNGLLNPKIRVYESENYRAHYQEQTGQIVVVGPYNDKTRVQQADEPTEPGEPITLVESKY